MSHSRSRSRGRSHTVVPSGNRMYNKYERLYKTLRGVIEDYRGIYASCNVTIGDIRSDLMSGDSEDILVPLNVSHLPNIGHFERFVSQHLQATSYLQAELELDNGKSVVRFFCHIDRKEFRNPQSPIVQRLRKIAPLVAIMLFLFAYFYFMF